MGSSKEYDPEPLVEAITALDWNVEHARIAVKTIQETILKITGEDVSELDALKVLGRLVECRFIRTGVNYSTQAVGFPRAGPTCKAKYFRVPEEER